MPVVIFVGQLRPGGQDLFRQIVVGVFIGCFLLLQVNDTNDIAILIIGIAVAEFFLKQLDAVEVSGISIIVIYLFPSLMQK